MALGRSTSAVVVVRGLAVKKRRAAQKGTTPAREQSKIRKGADARAGLQPSTFPSAPFPPATTTAQRHPTPPNATQRHPPPSAATRYHLPPSADSPQHHCGHQQVDGFVILWCCLCRLRRLAAAVLSQQSQPLRRLSARRLSIIGDIGARSPTFPMIEGLDSRFRSSHATPASQASTASHRPDRHSTTSTSPPRLWHCRILTCRLPASVPTALSANAQALLTPAPPPPPSLTALAADAADALANALAVPCCRRLCLRACVCRQFAPPRLTLPPCLALPCPCRLTLAATAANAHFVALPRRFATGRYTPRKRRALRFPTLQDRSGPTVKGPKIVAADFSKRSTKA
ncbi:uncharacterized protein PSFLO_06467 [Pseudozyma flocculosa]|uniref:Uncharacterized protein n=1 Tax=Pseudozyma flocculosa TaxID=84751 RepID=A0A5C3FBC2_9BASI|nr:uncharacterized protein PSFLO_06467 [Pseudozyma flocculosa]